MNIENDKLIKNMLENSMREITNPEFTNIVLNRIMIEDRNKFILRSISLYFLVFVTVSTAIIFIIRSVFLDLDSVALPSISGTITRAGLWVSENSHFIIPLLILLLVKKLMTYRLKLT